MNKRLMVVSPSTKKYAEEYTYDDMLIVTHPPDKDILKDKDKYEDVIAIGGGSVIDTAKIISINTIVAIPTTYSGASSTKYAVYWDNGQKRNIECKVPVTIVNKIYLKHLPKEVEMASKIDCLCHIIESLVSFKSSGTSTKFAMDAIELIKRNNWLDASILAGSAINITGTNLIHGMSYSLTAKYNMPHGVALSSILNLAETYRKIEELL